MFTPGGVCVYRFLTTITQAELLAGVSGIKPSSASTTDGGFYFL
jgi:hypothetical protein